MKFLRHSNLLRDIYIYIYIQKINPAGACGVGNCATAFIYSAIKLYPQSPILQSPISYVADSR